jgi:hypothetical protein
MNSDHPQFWLEAGFDAISGVFRQTRFLTIVQQAIRAMIFNVLASENPWAVDEVL